MMADVSGSGATSSPQLSSSLSRKLNKVLELNTEEPELLAALNHLSGWYGPPHAPNSKHARRLLRSDLERQTLRINKDFLLAFSLVQLSLEQVEGDVGRMKESCLFMAERLSKTRLAAGKLILTADKKENERKKEVAEAFLERFRLTEAEQATLRVGDIDELFFDALKHVGQIYSECPVLLRTHQKAGFEVMEAMSMEQQSAYDRLYRWVKDEFATLRDDPSEINPFLIVAVSTLQEKQPVLLSYCFDEIVHTRSQVSLGAFHAALTVGGPGGTPRPIEMHAHDPLRYVGDMLAWLHQAVASEYELLNRVFGTEGGQVTGNRVFTEDKAQLPHDARHAEEMPNKQQHPPRHAVYGTKHNIRESLAKVLSRIFEPLLQPFKIRLDQVLDPHSKPSTVEVFRINNMLDFYSRMITRIMGHGASLPSLFSDCKEEVLKLFYDTLKSDADILLSRAPMEIMATFDESLVPMDERAAEFAPVLSAVIDPLSKACAISATALKAADMAVYLINCLSVVQGSVSAYDFATSRVEALGMHIESHLDTLVTEETARFLRNCGIAEKMAVLQYRTTQGPLSLEPGMDSRSLATAVRGFERSLSDLEAFIMPHCDKLMEHNLRATARSRVGDNIVGLFSALHEAVYDPRNKYDEPRMVVRYKPEQVKTIVDAL
ncbi:golgi family protein, putative [Acanthamoeba castellanii str. Neff]|uniref:Conserved oligomeric Golgi complex subunit 6 n=1 Tax=Acanthamoeba castellanii (strain ATCC 30010 / Neff) TaxID=1257118 RepID=L8HC92_ACACF|nr:golgi family protein, putative [Acanthamoeba castellanii str. Neff]ELR22857.1 golgi family protein, putative [Acanthamoeba castellanii str. Neff]